MIIIYYLLYDVYGPNASRNNARVWYGSRKRMWRVVDRAHLARAPRRKRIGSEDEVELQLIAQIIAARMIDSLRLRSFNGTFLHKINRKL